MFTHREASEKIDSFRGAASRERKRERRVVSYLGDRGSIFSGGPNQETS